MMGLRLICEETKEKEHTGTPCGPEGNLFRADKVFWPGKIQAK